MRRNIAFTSFNIEIDKNGFKIRNRLHHFANSSPLTRKTEHRNTEN
jgi:hypothetical protein